jgi:two-component system sensor histidine kinase UhpB
MSARPTRAARDLLWVLLAVASFALLAVNLDLSEKIAHWSHALEALQADEFTLTLLVLSLGLSWFAFRRLHEVRAALMDREQAQQQVAHLLQHNRELTQRLISAQEDERRALSRELHDEIGQTCTALRIEAAWITHAQPADWPAVIQSAQRIEQTSARMHGMARDMLKHLRPPDLDTLGLVGALHALCTQWEEQCGVACGLYPSVSVDLSDAQSMAMYRVVQEALNNIARHARATQVRVTIDAAAQGLLLLVQDNGVGITTTPDNTGLGMLGMRERVAALGGAIEWTRTAQGTLVKVTLPPAHTAGSPT